MEAPILRWSQRSFKNHSLVSENGCLGMHNGIQVVYRLLETIFPLFFIPLVPYPARSARHLPHAGKAVCRGYRFPHPTSAPSGHLLPWEGGNDHASLFLWKGLPSAARRGWLSFLRRSGALVNGALETIFPALFHTASTLSGSLRSPPSPRGEGFVRRYCFSPHMRVFALTMREKRYSRFAAFPIVVMLLS